MISAGTGLPGDNARRAIASDVTRAISAPPGKAISTRTERRVASAVMRRTCPGTRSAWAEGVRRHQGVGRHGWRLIKSAVSAMPRIDRYGAKQWR